MFGLRALLSCVAQLGVLSVALDIARGMEYVHGMSVCHGDLSAGNVLLHKDHDILTAKVRNTGGKDRSSVSWSEPWVTDHHLSLNSSWKV